MALGADYKKSRGDDVTNKRLVCNLALGIEVR
jgi:hypothetical protein